MLSGGEEWPQEDGLCSSSSSKVTPQPGHERRGDCAQQLSQVGAGSGQDDVGGISGQTFQQAASHTIVTLEVADLWFNGTPSPSAFLLRSSQLASAAAGQMNGRTTVVVMAAVARGDVCVGDVDAGRLRHGRLRHGRLRHGRDGLRQRVAIAGVPLAQVDTDDPVAWIRRRHRHLLTGLVPLVSLPLADAHDVWFMQTVELLLVSPLLSMQSLAQLQQFFQSRRSIASTDSQPNARQ